MTTQDEQIAAEVLPCGRTARLGYLNHTCTAEQHDFDCPASFRPALIAALSKARADTVEACAKVAAMACLVEPDGGSPTDDERIVAETAAHRIRALVRPIHCEICGGEGKIYTSRYGGNDPDVWPIGACEACEGTGYERILGRDNSEIVTDCSICRALASQPDQGEPEEGAVMADGNLRMLGACDGIIGCLVDAKRELGRLTYDPIPARHTRLRREQSLKCAALRWLIEKWDADLRATQAAYTQSTKDQPNDR